MTHPPGRAILPGEESYQRSGRRAVVAVEQVELCRVLESSRALDQLQAEKADIEIDIGLDLPGDGRDVVKAARHVSRSAFSFP
jgi:hypothetical protein